MFDKKNKFETMTYKCWINYSLVFFVFLFFIMFGWLQTHNLYQTQYLIYYDFWRNFDALKEGNDIYPFVFHFIHTYVVASAIWYSDVLFAAGSLKLVHAYVVVATLISFYCVFLLIHSLHSTGTTPRSYIVFTQAGGVLGCCDTTHDRDQNAAKNLEQFVPQALLEITSVSAKADMRGSVRTLRAETKP